MSDLCHPPFLLLCSPGLVDRDKVPVFAFGIVQLLDELADPVVAFQRARAFLGHRDCDNVVFFWLNLVALGALSSLALGRMSCALVAVIGTAPSDRRLEPLCCPFGS